MVILAGVENTAQDQSMPRLFQGSDLKPFMDVSVMLCIEIKDNLICLSFFVLDLSALISHLAMSLKRSETATERGEGGKRLSL